jgi:hypothetical protein
MKKLKVTMHLEMSVPDDWTLVQTSAGGQVVKLSDGQFLDLTFEPMLANDPEQTWSSTDDDEVLNTLLDMVDSEDVSYEFVTH